MYLNWNVNEMTVAETEISIDSEYLKRKVTVALLMPEGSSVSAAQVLT